MRVKNDHRSEFYMTVFSGLSRENEKLLKSQRFKRRQSQRVIMQVHKPKVEYKLALQEKPQGSILTYYKTINNLTKDQLIKHLTNNCLQYNQTRDTVLKQKEYYSFPRDRPAKTVT